METELTNVSDLKIGDYLLTDKDKMLKLTDIIKGGVVMELAGKKKSGWLLVFNDEPYGWFHPDEIVHRKRRK